MRIAELTPEKTLQEVLDNALVVELSETSSRTVKAYEQGSVPNTGLPDEFLTIMHNGAIRAMTYPIGGAFRGYLAVVLYCKANSNSTAKLNRINSLVEQMQTLLENKTYGNFHYKFNPDNVITPVTVNRTTGYATTAVNISWHTT